MSQLIIDSLFRQPVDKQLPISALLAVSPGFKTALTPWYVTNHCKVTSAKLFDNAAFYRSDSLVRDPLPWPTIKFLHSSSPFSFQFATALCIELKDEREIDEFITSDAARCLFRQLPQLVMFVPSTFNDNNSFSHFIQQFGLLRQFRLRIIASTDASQETVNNVFTFYCDLLSQSSTVTRQYSLILDVVKSMMGYLPIKTVTLSSPAYQLIETVGNLMNQCFKKDDGDSFGLFIKLFIFMVGTDVLPLRPFFPLFDLLETVILNGDDFRKVTSRSNRYFNYPEDYFSGDENYRYFFASDVLSLIKSFLPPGQENAIREFVQKYGRSMITKFSRVVFSLRWGDDGEEYCDFANGEHDKIEWYHGHQEEMFELISKNIDEKYWRSSPLSFVNTNFSSSLAMSSSDDHKFLQHFPFDVLCDLVEKVIYDAAANTLARCIAPLPAILWSDFVRECASMSADCCPQIIDCKLPQKLFDFLRGFDSYDHLDYLSNHEGEILAPGEAISRVIEVLNGMLFGQEGAEGLPFYVNVRNSFFGVVGNFKVVDQAIRWGLHLVEEMKKENEEIETQLREKTSSQALGSVCIETRHFFDDIRRFLKKISSTVIGVDFAKNNEVSEEKRAPLLFGSELRQRTLRTIIDDLKDLMDEYDKLRDWLVEDEREREI